MADDEFEEFEGDPVLGTRLVCRGLEGGLRETVAVNEPVFFRRGERVTLVVDAILDHVAFPSHKLIDSDDDEEGVDRLHITKLETVAIIDRSLVADQLDAQALRIAAARAEREAAKAAEKERRKAERKAQREGVTTMQAEHVSGSLFDAVAAAVPTNDDDPLTEAEREAERMFAGASG